MRIEEEIKLDYSDVLFRPKRSTLKSRSEVDLRRKYKFKHSKLNWEGVPIIASNMDGVGEVGIAKKLSSFKMMTALTKQHGNNNIKDLQKNNSIHNYVALSCGTSKESYARLNNVLKKNPKFKFICIDVANGYRDDFMDFIRKVRKTYPEKIIIAGNVVTPEGVKMILDAGANIVKVGIGNGSACATRMKTGIGYPQFSAILECQKIAHLNGGYILSDGGCKDPAEIVKAFGAGADFVMCGGIFAGHKESGGDLVTDAKGQLIKMFYGMSSDTAMQKYAGGVAKYRTSEGLTIKIPYKGEVEKTLLDICGGIRSACTYLNSSNIRELHDNVEFVRVNNIK